MSKASSVEPRFNPEDFDIPANYGHWHGDGAEDYIGPFFFYVDGDIIHTAFRVQEHHCNAHGSVHGGVLMTFADYLLCLAAHSGDSESVATISCNSEFIAPAWCGDLVLGRGEMVKKTGSMVFVRSEISANDEIILTSSAVVKRIRLKQA